MSYSHSKHTIKAKTANPFMLADVHARIHPKWDMLPNGTFISGQMAHTGQFFVPDDINVRVDKVSALDP